MIPMVSFAESEVLDSVAVSRYGIDEMILLETAAEGMYRKILDSQTGISENTVVFLVGSGNNGCDALAIARRFHCNFPTMNLSIVSLGSKVNSLNDRYRVTAEKLGIPVYNWILDESKSRKLLSEASIIVDGILGTGQKGTLRDSVKTLIEASTMNKKAFRIAIDVPSGIFSPDQSFHADSTLCVVPLKHELWAPAFRDNCGEIIPIFGVFPNRMTRLPTYGFFDKSDIAPLLPLISRSIHKTQKGHVLVYAGSTGTHGAALLASESALRSRSGLVTIHVDASIYPILASACTAVMIQPTSNTHIESNNKATVLAGPGWGRSDWNKNFLSTCIEAGNKLVVDADAIHLLAEISRERTVDLKGNAILTPHPGEFAMLSSVSIGETSERPLESILEISKRLNAVIVYKSYVTWIVSPDANFAVIDGRNPALATAGSGDVLSGMIAGLFSSGMSAFEAAICGTLAHQEAGRLAFTELGNFSSVDLLPFIGKLLAV